jgi:hypothetical protein
MTVSDQMSTSKGGIVISAAYWTIRCLIVAIRDLHQENFVIDRQRQV